MKEWGRYGKVAYERGRKGRGRNQEKGREGRTKGKKKRYRDTKRFNRRDDTRECDRRREHREKGTAQIPREAIVERTGGRKKRVEVGDSQLSDLEEVSFFSGPPCGFLLNPR